MSARLRGTVKWFNDAKGYGFVTPDGGGKDYFVHYSSLNQNGHKSLNEGDIVEFDGTPGTKGPQAEKVVVIERASQVQ